MEGRLTTMEANQGAARAGTRVDGSHRPENRGERAAVTSQGYLAQGLQQRIAQLGEALRILADMGTGERSRVVMGAWFAVESEAGVRRQFALMPGGDATTLCVGDDRVQVLSPSAPLVQNLLGLEEGDEAQLPGLGEVVLLWIR